MGIVLSILVVLQILSAIGMVAFIMLQQGKGADMGASFGSGASGSLFGATGTANFLSRTTAVLATVFFLSTLAQSFLSGSVRATNSSSVLESAAAVDATKKPEIKIDGANPAEVKPADAKPAADAATTDAKPEAAPEKPAKDAIPAGK